MIEARCCAKCANCEKVYSIMGYALDKEVADRAVSKLSTADREAVVIEVKNGQFLVCICNGFKCGFSKKSMTLKETLDNWCHNYSEIALISDKI